MNPRFLLPVIVLVLTAGVGADAAPPYLEFVEGLRQRQLYDYALLQLDELEGQPAVPQDVKTVIPHERAITLIAQAQSLANPDAQRAVLDEAEAQLERFVSINPNHLRAAQANSQRAEINLNRARVEIVAAQSPANAGNSQPFREKARQLVAKSREIFQAAHDQHKTTWESFDRYIDPEREREIHDARDQAQTAYIRSQIDLALCTYEEAQTYPRESQQYQQLLNKAANEFAKIHEAYRSMGAGLYARMWQGKCFEEQGEIGKALGIYDELLRHPGQSQTMQIIQNQVLQFRLICLNHESKKDYQLVIGEADNWIQNHRGSGRNTQVGLGIQWEAARAQESMGHRRDISPPDRERYLKQALATARQINRFAGKYQDVSMFMIRRLQAELEHDVGDPKDFDTALGLANAMLKEIGPQQESIDSQTDPQERAKLEQDLQLHLNELARILRLALELGYQDEKEPQEVNAARYMLAYIYYLSNWSFDCAVLAEFVAERYREESADIALDCAYLALAGYQQAYSAAPKDQRHFEVEQMVRVSNLIAKHWPDSDKANDARMTLGLLYSQSNRPAEAADWYSKVPESAKQYSQAQLDAGQAYWSAYLHAAASPADEQPDAETLSAWQEQAERHLKVGIEQIGQTVPSDSEPPEKLTAAKVTLAQILISQGKYTAQKASEDEPLTIDNAGSIELLTGFDHPVIDAIQSDGPRPKTGVKSQLFASLAYQLLLRSYVGTQNIDKALDAMSQLEQLFDEGGELSDDGASVTQVYVELGKEIQKELNRLVTLKQTERLQQVRESFKQFLSAVAQREQGQTYGSLIWIAATYNGLGEGSTDDDQEAKAFFSQSAQAYREILERDGSDSGFVKTKYEDGVRLRLAAALKNGEKFNEAIDVVGEILSRRPNALDGQFAAAEILEAWGDANRTDSLERYLEAIRGREVNGKEQVIWGWSKLAKQLGTRLQIEKMKSSPDRELVQSFEEKFLSARYHVSSCRWKYGKALSGSLDNPKKKQAFEAAMSEVNGFAITGLINDNWWDDFDELYQDIQTDMGNRNPKPLQRPMADIASTNTPAPPAGVEEVVEEKSEGPTTIEPPPTNWVLIGVGLVVVLGLTGGVFFLLMKQPKRVRPAYATSFAGLPDAQSASQSTSARSSSTKTKTKRKAAAGTKPSKLSRSGKTQSPGRQRPSGGSPPSSSK